MVRLICKHEKANKKRKQKIEKRKRKNKINENNHTLCGRHPDIPCVPSTEEVDDALQLSIMLKKTEKDKWVLEESPHAEACSP